MWLQVLLSLGLVLFVSSTEDCKPKACNRRVENDKPVCGSDGITYPNRCHLEKSRCQNKNLTFVQRGSCKEHRVCIEAVAYANKHTGYSFKPQCRADGSYSPSQCNPVTGYCWCVTPLGAPLPFTSVQWRSGIKHKCSKRRKSKRRSPSKKNRNKPCKHSDKVTFNGNLIGMFFTEWKREQEVPPTSANDSILINWKFADLDGNSDGRLDKMEYRELRKMVKSAVKPKKCAKTFFRSCDINADQIIELREWADCLSRNGMDEGRGQNTSNDNEEQEEEMDTLPSRSPPHGVLSQDTIPIGQSLEEDSAEAREEEPANCMSDRQTALSEGSQLYIPECTLDGRYQKIQCYKSAGYCWCVHEDTGKNIPGTSVKNDTPKCDQLVQVARPMKGCPEDKKAAFLRELMVLLQSRMNSTSAMHEFMWRVSKEEHAAKVSFGMFDKNKNKMLDRNEWKSFKEMVIAVKSLKKCGKKLPRYCDINKDRQISMTEWLLCLNVQQVAVSANSAGNVTSSRYGKKNPLSMLLED